LCLPLVAWGQQITPVAAGVYASIADLGDVTPANRGEVGNLGFVVGDTGVLAIDAGVSYRHGEAFMKSIAATTPLPVVLVVLTDPIQEFHFGAAPFQDRGVPILAHREAAALIAQRCATCLQRLRVTLGEAEMARSRVVVPDRLIDETTSLKVGGRELELLYFGRTAAPGNLAVLDRRSGVLFAGGLVSVDRIPRLRDGDLDAWIGALERLDAVGATVIVPGHGPVCTPAQARRTLDYLLALRSTVETLYRRGVGLGEARKSAELAEFRDWSLYATLHPENVQELYLRLERADLEGPR